MPFFEHRHNIGVWWWEVDVLPDEWHDAFELLDEVWVGTEHVARALAPVSPMPGPHGALPDRRAPRVEPLPRAALGLEDEWMFLSMFDHGSVLERKNPLGTIAAFAEAFAPDSGAVLVLKSSQRRARPDRPRARARRGGAATRTCTSSRATSRPSRRTRADRDRRLLRVAAPRRGPRARARPRRWRSASR